MNSIQLIAKHLDESNLKLEVHDGISELCAFSGRKISRGVKNKELIKKTFTDHSYLRYNSDYSSVEAAMCIEAVIKSEKGFNSLRSYSFLVTEAKFKIIKRENLLDILTDPPKGLFVLVSTYSNKKHISYKSVINSNVRSFLVSTDKGNVNVNKSDLDYLLPIISKWYTIIKGKEKTTAPPTYFTKKEILNGSENIKRIKAYGIDNYYAENMLIEKYRNTDFIDLLVHALNKK